MTSKEIFLSYNSMDRNLASSVKQKLKAHGFGAFLAHQDIEVSKKWREEIQKHLDTCCALVAIVTKHFDESSWTNQEVGIAIGKGKPVASLIFDTEDLPGFLEAMQGVKAAENKLDKPISKVIRVINRLLRSSGVFDVDQKAVIKDEYIQFSNRSKYLKNDTLSVLEKYGFGYCRDKELEIQSYWISRSYRPHVLSAMKRISVPALGFYRTYRFLIDFLDEWSSHDRYWNPYAMMIAKHEHDEYHSSKYNNVWIELSYGKFRESSLRVQAGRVGGSRVWPTGYTVIPVTPFLSYVGPDRTSCNFGLLEKRFVSKLKYTGSLIRDGKLSRGAILNSIAKMVEKASGDKKKALEHELQDLRKVFRIPYGDLRADPGFVAHGVKSKHHIETTIGTMLDWIKNNGHWL